MVTTREQYEVYPYPERDPADEAKRLIVGSPTNPLEIDHFLYAGHRDWSKPLRALVAGGGTGDGLIQLAAILTAAGRPYEITYLDLSTTSRAVAEARAKVRKLKGITFVTGSLLDAGDLGTFDYIDCCGVLHHLPDPAIGFAALRAALKDDGGMGFMVYAPYGRSGVYPLQEAFGDLLAGLNPKERLAQAKQIVQGLPEGHPFRTNQVLRDHEASDAGFYDLLLHGQDRAFSVGELLQVLDQTGWRLQSFTMPALYDLSLISDYPHALSPDQTMQVAEKLRGTIKTHVGYAVAKDSQTLIATGRERSAVPHLKGVSAQALAKAIKAGRSIPIREGTVTKMFSLPKATAPLVAAINGKRQLKEIATIPGVDPVAFGNLWSAVEAGLAPWGLLLYSDLRK